MRSTVHGMLPLWIGLVLLGSPGCRHALEIHREGEWAIQRDYYQRAEPDRPIEIGEIHGPPGPPESDILLGVRSGLDAGRYYGGAAEPVVLDLYMTTEFSGDWINIVIAWPGFIIFAPKWAGFQYHVTYVFDAVYQLPDGSSWLARTTCGYRMAYCNGLQGFLTIGLGWITGGSYLFGTPALLAGFFMTGYVDGLTPFVMEVAQGDVPEIVDFVTDRIIYDMNQILAGP